MTEDDFDNLVDDASHAVFNRVPAFILGGMDAEDRSDLLIRINDALAPILRDLSPSDDDSDEASKMRPSTIGAFISELIETHMEKCESAGEGPDERPAHIICETFGTEANIASVATSSTDDEARVYIVFEDGDAFRLAIERVDGVQ
ncbi:MAG: hypothetical protein H2055_06890 [Sphingopyxis sp.]|nr:hypothetical protein [Sphingopyxis sp.]